LQKLNEKLKNAGTSARRQELDQNLQIAVTPPVPLVTRRNEPNFSLLNARSSPPKLDQNLKIAVTPSHLIARRNEPNSPLPNAGSSPPELDQNLQIAVTPPAPLVTRRNEPNFSLRDARSSPPKLDQNLQIAVTLRPISPSSQPRLLRRAVLPSQLES
jgi:hypothetical protein